MPPPTTQLSAFLADLALSVEAWHAGEIDHATFTALHAATWASIRQAGSNLEEQVLRTLRDQLPPQCQLLILRSVRQGRRYRR
jgi:hypothetical protein